MQFAGYKISFMQCYKQAGVDISKNLATQGNCKANQRGKYTDLRCLDKTFETSSFKQRSSNVSLWKMWASEIKVFCAFGLRDVIPWQGK